MSELTLNPITPEMEVIDLHGDRDFMGRQHRTREIQRVIAGMQRLAHVFARSPKDILQELVDVSVEMCGADSAGITLEEPIQNGETQFRWIATAGKYGGFLGAVLPRSFSPCGTCLDRGSPQLFRVSKAYLDMIGVDAPPVTDGLLIPWQVEGIRGTIWILAHGPFELFDSEDYRLLQSLADVAATGVRYKKHQETLQMQAASKAAFSMANDLAHQINNPLQSLVQTLFLLGLKCENSDPLIHQAMEDLGKLTTLVRQLLQIPKFADSSLPDSF